MPLSLPLRSGAWLDPGGLEYPIEGARLLDVSTGGAQLRLREQVVPGSVMRRRFTLFPADRPVVVQAMVTGASADQQLGMLRLHVQFIEMSDHSRAQLERFVTDTAARLPRAA